MDDYGRAVLAEYLRRQKRGPARFCPHEPTGKQRAFLDYDGLEALYGGAAGGGKSDAILMGALKYIDVPGYAALILRRTFADLSLDGALMDRARKWLAGTDARWNDRDHRWTIPGGGAITFGYLQDPGDELRYQSAEFQYIGFDEVTQLREKQYRYMFSRCRRRIGVNVPLRVRGATNPGGPGHVWVKGRFGIDDDVDMERVHVGPKGRRFFPAKLDDNPHIDRDEYRRSLEELDSITRDQLERGSWRQDTSTLVYKFDEHRHCVDELPRLPRGMSWSTVLAADYGNVDATALGALNFCVEYSDGVWLAESDKWAGLDPYGAAEILSGWMGRYKTVVGIVGDLGGLGKGYGVESRNRFGIPIEAAEKTNKLGFIKLLNGAYERDKFKVVRGTNEKFIIEVQALPWKDERRLEELPGVPNDLCDMGLYGWRKCRGFMHVEPPTKPKPGTPEYDDAIEQQIEAEDDAVNQEDEWDGMV